jgi:hypothetical protein
MCQLPPTGKLEHFTEVFAAKGQSSLRRVAALQYIYPLMHAPLLQHGQHLSDRAERELGGAPLRLSFDGENPLI